MFRLALFVVAAAILVVSRTDANGDYGPFWERRAVTLFQEANSVSLNLLDNELTEEDFQRNADRSIAYFGWTAEYGNEFRQKHLDIWDLLNAANGNDGPITSESFPELLKKVGDYDFDASVANFYIPVHTIFNLDNEDDVSLEELYTIFQPFGVGYDIAENSFAFIDENDDDQMSADELLDAVKAWYYDTNEATADLPFIMAVAG